MPILLRPVFDLLKAIIDSIYMNAAIDWNMNPIQNKSLETIGVNIDTISNARIDGIHRIKILGFLWSSLFSIRIPRNLSAIISNTHANINHAIGNIHKDHIFKDAKLYIV